MITYLTIERSKNGITIIFGGTLDIMACEMALAKTNLVSTYLSDSKCVIPFVMSREDIAVKAEEFYQAYNKACEQLDALHHLQIKIESSTHDL